MNASLAVPYATLTVAAVCVGVFFGTDFATVAYERSADDAFQLLSASFAHYDAVHLVTNVFTLIVLGTAAEHMVGRLRFMAVVLTTIAATMTLLDSQLQHYTHYAGISPVNYALLGCLAGAWLHRHPARSAAIIAVLAASMFDQGFVTVADTKPAWELHLVGFCIGALFGRVRPAPTRPAYGTT
ncbi:MAG TPA: rhomboid family intramembrane serine protease [Pseudomonadales bacterium]